MAGWKGGWKKKEIGRKAFWIEGIDLGMGEKRFVI